MTTLTAEVTDEILRMTKEIMRSGMYKSQSEVVRDSIRQLALKYGIKGNHMEHIRKNVSAASKKSGKTLSRTVREIRDDE
ncbi:MAG TPA: hypothetical protein VI968_01320 [archaeon]|nr:hypothetical protein [archaeon]